MSKMTNQAEIRFYKIRRLLRKLKIADYYDASQYLVVAVLMLMKNKSLRILQDVYPTVAERFGKNSAVVRGNIEMLIWYMWDTEGREEYFKIFNKRKTLLPPDDLQFLRMLTEYLSREE